MQYPDLDGEQVEIFDALMRFAMGEGDDAIATLSGPAGSGKTVLVARLIHKLSSMMRVAVTAPTHKAVAVLREKVGDDECPAEFSTIHSLLGLRLRESQEGVHTLSQVGEVRLYEYALAIVDESSMVSDAIFASILSSRGRARILFVGDSAQAAPTDAADGALSPTFGPAVRIQHRLVTVRRVALENPILRVATMVRGHIESGTPVSLQDVCSMVRPGDEKFLAVMDGGPWQTAQMTASAIEAGLDVRALAYDNRTVLRVNDMVHQILRPGEPAWSPGVPVIAQEEFSMTTDQPGERIRVRNSELLNVVSCREFEVRDDASRPVFKVELSLANGATGEILVPRDALKWQRDISAFFAEHKRLKVQAMVSGGDQGATLHDMARNASSSGWALRNRYANIRHAYCMTIHKSQGSTFKASVVDWNSFYNCRDIETRTRLLYVALTRTSKFAVIVA